MTYMMPTRMTLSGLGAMMLAVAANATGTDNAPAASNQVKDRAAVPAASAVPASAPTPLAAGRWVPRISKRVCPNGTTTYEASDGGVKCWAGPTD